MSKFDLLDSRVTRLITDVAALKSDQQYGLLPKLERELGYVQTDSKNAQTDRDDLSKQIVAIFAILGVDPGTFQPLGDGNEQN